MRGKERETKGDRQRETETESAYSEQAISKLGLSLCPSLQVLPVMMTTMTVYS